MSSQWQSGKPPHECTSVESHECAVAAAWSWAVCNAHVHHAWSLWGPPIIMWNTPEIMLDTPPQPIFTHVMLFRTCTGSAGRDAGRVSPRLWGLADCTAGSPHACQATPQERGHGAATSCRCCSLRLWCVSWVAGVCIRRAVVH